MQDLKPLQFRGKYAFQVGARPRRASSCEPEPSTGLVPSVPAPGIQRARAASSGLAPGGWQRPHPSPPPQTSRLLGLDLYWCISQSQLSAETRRASDLGRLQECWSLSASFRLPGSSQVAPARGSVPVSSAPERRRGWGRPEQPGRGDTRVPSGGRQAARFKCSTNASFLCVLIRLEDRCVAC